MACKRTISLASEWDQVLHNLKIDVVRTSLKRPSIEAPESSEFSGHTSVVQEGYCKNKGLILEFGISENKNEMKQVRVTGAEAYGNRRK